ncbi:hypothetical protein [Wandonia haliotis]
MKKTMFILATITISALSCKKETVEPTPPVVPCMQENVTGQILGYTWILESTYLVEDNGLEHSTVSGFEGEYMNFYDNGTCYSSMRSSMLFDIKCDHVVLNKAQYKVDITTYPGILELLQINNNPNHLRTKYRYIR